MRRMTRIQHKIDVDQVRELVKQETPEERLAKFKALQIVVYVMVGGGCTGRNAAEQPGGFYIDDRAGPNSRPYRLKEIEQAVEVLKIYAEELGYNVNNLPRMQDFHNCGIF